MISKGKWAGSLVERLYGFQGIATNIEPSLLPDNLLPAATNISFNDSKITTVKGTQQIGSSLPAAIQMMFMWKKDDGTKVLFAQSGNTLYKYSSGWESVKTFNSSAPVSMVGGLFNYVYIMSQDGFFKYDGATITQINSAPKANYLLLWQTYLFTGGDLKESDGTGSKFRVRWSPIADASLNDWYSGDAINNYIDFRTSENSTIQGLGVWNRRIIVFTGDSIEEIAGSSPSNFIVNTIYKGHLTTVQNSVAYYDNVYYLSKDGLCIMARDAIMIGDIYKKYWNRNASSFSLAEWKGKLYGNSGSEILMYDTMNKYFEHYSVQGTNKIYSDDENLYIGTTDGKVLKWGEGSDILGWTFTTKESIFSSFNLYKRSMGLDLITDKSITSSVVTVRAIYDDGTIEDVGTFDPSLKDRIHFALKKGLFKSVQIQLSGTGDFSLIGMEITAKVKQKGGV